MAAAENGAERARIATPSEVDVVLECPSCGVIESVGAKLSTRLVVDAGASSKLSLRVRALKLEHVCEQETLGLES